MTCLRGWLGTHLGDDRPYLFPAYQGGYTVHDDIRRDREDFQLLTGMRMAPRRR